MNKFRASFFPAIEVSAEGFNSEEVGSYEMAKAILDNIAIYTLHLHEQSVMHDYSNAGWVEQFVDDEWVDIEEDS